MGIVCRFFFVVSQRDLKGSPLKNEVLPPSVEFILFTTALSNGVILRTCYRLLSAFVIIYRSLLIPTICCLGNEVSPSATVILSTPDLHTFRSRKGVGRRRRPLPVFVAVPIAHTNGYPSYWFLSDIK